MKATGIVRRIDDLGRVVIPNENVVCFVICSKRIFHPERKKPADR